MGSRKKDVNFKRVMGLVATVLFVAAFLLYTGVLVGYKVFEQNNQFSFDPGNYINFPYLSSTTSDVKTFDSEEEFKEYLQSGATSGFSGMNAARSKSLSFNEMMPSPISDTFGLPSATTQGSAGRVSTTNVQVAGIDEPDILKTDGQEIYYSPQNQWVKPMPVPMMKSSSGITREMQEKIMRPDIMPPYPYPTPATSGTQIIKAFPVQKLAKEGKIEEFGTLLLSENTLMVFSDRAISGYDVSNPTAPIKKWNLNLDNNSYVVSSRLYQNKVYLITRNIINETRPCPVQPFSANNSPISIPCREIYHPVVPIEVDVTYVVSRINTITGKIEDKVSFVGSSGSSTIYVSENSIYVAYPYNDSMIKFFSGFLKENTDVFPSWMIERADKLAGYEISEQSKLTELMTILQKYTMSLSEDERMKSNNEITNRMSDYYKKHKREIEYTGIMKIGLGNLNIDANGSVPGVLLNQFSMDEYKGNLRVATTIGNGIMGGLFGGMSTGGSVNDVYVLDKNLNTLGSVKDLGETERIYSARFIEERGYLVTFRQTDPFYVLDLSNPKIPQLKGELKIPGYSSYLHPLGDNKILGIGQENWQVKISVFDVSNAQKPVELDKYILDENWTDVSNNYHAFLQDAKHKVFFLPGGKGGYVFSYDNDKLQLEKAVSQIAAKRAMYINDYLYIVGDDKITVLNETTWEKVNDLDL